VKLGKGVPFGSFVQKFSPHPNIPQIPKMLHYESSFSRKTRINTGGSAAKIRIRIEKTVTDHGNFKFGVKNLTGSRILAFSAHAQQKIG